MRNENLLLASLPEAERQRLSPYLKRVVLEFQQVLIEPDQEITDVYFPYNAITSTVQEMSDGASVETGLMGDSPLNDLCAKYVHAFLVMTSQVAACNRLHPMNERLCRWLKLVYNRLRRDEFPIRHEFLAMMLGVHRPTVSTTENMLRQAGLIKYNRGQMRILDADGLRNGSCECLELMEKQVERIFDGYFIGT